MAALQDPKQMVTVTELDDLLQCPVCYEVPAGHIYQCNQGHHVCGDCKLRIDLCPVCRSMFFGTRNYAMEELISNIVKLKQAKTLASQQKSISGEDGTSSSSGTFSSSSNTTVGLTDTDRTENTSETSRRPPVMCPGLFRCLCCSWGRKERLPIARMLNHLRYWHSLDLIEGKLENDKYEQVWQIPMQNGRTVIAIRVAELGIYFLVVEIQSNNLPMELHSWLSMVASPTEADNYTYNLTFTGADREAAFTDSVLSVRSCEGQLKKRRRCLILDNENMHAFTSSQIVSVGLCIRRVAERRDDLPTRHEPRAALRIANRSLSDGSTNGLNSPDGTVVRNAVERSPRDSQTRTVRLEIPAHDANGSSRQNAATQARSDGDAAGERVASAPAAPRLSSRARRRLNNRLNNLALNESANLPPANRPAAVVAPDAGRPATAPVPPPAPAPAHDQNRRRRNRNNTRNTSRRH